MNLVLRESELEKIRKDEKLRLDVIENGIRINPNHKAHQHRYFGGRYFVPYDKGGASDIKGGWLPNYFVPTDYYIDYCEKSADCLINNKPIRKSSTATYPRNKTFYFKEGISFSDSGIYSPSYRLSEGHLFDQKGSLIIPENSDENLIILGVISSRLGLFLLKNYCNHSISSHVDSIKMNLIPRSKIEIKDLVKSIMANQKQNQKYDYITNEQLEIDKLIYEMYNLNEEDIKEVENWYYRRYPKLATAIEEKRKVKNND